MATSSAPSAKPVRLATYNVLAQSLAKSSWFPYTDRPVLRWKNRKHRLIQEIRRVDADVLCLQEVDQFSAFYEGELKALGYDCLYLQRPHKTFGSAVCVKSDSFRIVRSIPVFFDDTAEALAAVLPDDPITPDVVDTFRKHGVGLVAEVAPVIDTGSEEGEGEDDPSEVGDKRKAGAGGGPALGEGFIVATSHIFWNPAVPQVKLSQVLQLRVAMAGFNTDRLPCAVLADFNSLPKSEVDVFMRRPLDLPPIPLSLISGHTPLTSRHPDWLALLGRLVVATVPMPPTCPLPSLPPVDPTTVSTQSAFFSAFDYLPTTSTDGGAGSGSGSGSGSGFGSVELDGTKLGDDPANAARKKLRFTTWTEKFVGEIDFVYLEDGRWQTPPTGFLLPPTAEEAAAKVGFPSIDHPSDHLPLAVNAVPQPPE